MRSPSGGEARRRGGTQVGKAPPTPEMSISGLTKGQFVGDDDVAKHFIIPRLCRTLRPAPQAGCFVSRLLASKDSAQITLRHRAFGTVALAPSSASTKRPPAAPLCGEFPTPVTSILYLLFALPCRAWGLFRLWAVFRRGHAFQYLGQPFSVFVGLLFEPSSQAFDFFCRCLTLG